jgi:hypothetical protein
MVRSPKDRGGLGIKDPSLMNLDLGAKLVWRLITRKVEWWKKVLLKKYFQGNCKRCIDRPLENKKGSHIWKLLKVIAQLFNPS